MSEGREEEDLRRFLKRNYAVLASGLDTKNLLTELYSADVISDDQFDQLRSLKKAGKGSREITEDLLGMFQGKDGKALVGFLRCVQEKQPHLVGEIAHLLNPAGPVMATGGLDDGGANHPYLTNSLLSRCTQEGSLPVMETPESSFLATHRLQASGDLQHSVMETQSPCFSDRRSGMDPSSSKADVTDSDIQALAQKIGSKWKKVVRYLPNASCGNRDELAFTEEKMTEIAKSESTAEDRMIKALHSWRNMTSLHRWAELYDAFVQANLESHARDVFVNPEE